MIIEKAHIQNFRCLKDVEIHFTPLTVFVGPNGSGKSSAMKILEADFIPLDSKDWYGHTFFPVLNLANISMVPYDRIDYINKNINNANISDNYVLNEVISFNNNRKYTSSMLELNPDNLRIQQQLKPESKLDRNGGNLTNLINTIPRRDRENLARELCKIIPLFNDVDIRPVSGIESRGYIEIIFQDRWNQDVWYQADQVSDGTMLTLAFLTLQFQPEPPDLLLIEEPERGIHPYLMEQIVDLLRKLAEGYLGKKAIQVIVATHSAEFMAYAKPEEVRFFDRNPENGTTRVTEIDTKDPNWERNYEEFARNLGNIWLTGSLGGV